MILTDEGLLAALAGPGFVAPDEIRLLRCTDEAVDLIQQCHLRQLTL